MSTHLWGKNTQYFYELSPENILNAIDRLGYRTTGRSLPLNSLENRVYEIEVDEGFIIAKFFRPGRWIREQIQEEHDFLFALQEAELPVVAPIKINGESVFTLPDLNIYYCLFPRQAGRLEPELNNEQLAQLGRLLGRLHNVGAQVHFKHRLTLNLETMLDTNVSALTQMQVIPTDLEKSFTYICDHLKTLCAPVFAITPKTLTIHGDCHLGNILWRGDAAHLVDFDDSITGPAVQDIWLCTRDAGEREILIENYETFREFNHHELKMIEPLRALRFIHHATWLAKRYEDPAFQNAFPQFATRNFWEMKLQDLREQLALIQESF
jgi:Ser/Thr protein kinase RdoA (MazF antagonist)